jgi:hypothetical protein
MSALLKPPFSKTQLHAMHSKDYDYCWTHYRSAVELALNLRLPPVPAPPFPRSDLKKLALGETMAAEYVEYAKKEGHVLADGTIPEFVYDEFIKSKQEAQQLKDAEAECQRWVNDHETYDASESNRVALWNWLQEKELPLTYKNLDQAFAALVRSGDIKALLPVADRPETRPGQWKNGIFTPFETDGAQGTVKTAFFGLGQLDPSKVASGDKQVTKRASQMSAEEYQRNLNESPSFRKKMNESQKAS